MKDIYCGNPTCQYCGATYGIAELHNCAAKQEALRKRKEESIAHLEKELSKARITLRDQFAMAIISGFAGNNAIFAQNPMSGWSLVNCDTDQLCATAYGMADAMLEARTKQPE